jgi:hypothetical protein
MSATPDPVLRERCEKIRARDLPVDEPLVAGVEAEVEDCRRLRVKFEQRVPPDDVAQRLFLLGWLIYEASLVMFQKVEAAYEALPPQRRERSEQAVKLVVRLADAARALPWPEFAPRALGAIRGQALAASKRDTQSGYDEAWLLHEEARDLYEDFREIHEASAGRQRHLLALKETQVQLALAETGTACRTAELVIGRWSEEAAKGTWTDDDADEWTQRMFRDLSTGVATGEEALDLVATIEHDHGLAGRVDEHRMVLPTAYQNPAIMTARAALLMLSLCPEMERLGRSPLWGNTSWPRMHADLLRRFREAYRRVERPAYGFDGQPMKVTMAHARSLVQLRLHATIVAPGLMLRSKMLVDPLPCLDGDRLGDAEIEQTSRWLAGSEDGKQRGDANVIGSATMPSFIRSVEECRRLRGVIKGYREWREQWFALDRHAAEEGRPERVRTALRDA